MPVTRTMTSWKPPFSKWSSIPAPPIHEIFPNNWACGAAEEFHHRRLIEAGVQILGYPKMLHAKAFVADGKQVLVGT